MINGLNTETSWERGELDGFTKTVWIKTSTYNGEIPGTLSKVKMSLIFSLRNVISCNREGLEEDGNVRIDCSGIERQGDYLEEVDKDNE